MRIGVATEVEAIYKPIEEVWIRNENGKLVKVEDDEDDDTTQE